MNITQHDQTHSGTHTHPTWQLVTTNIQAALATGVPLASHDEFFWTSRTPVDSLLFISTPQWWTGSQRCTFLLKQRFFALSSCSSMSQRSAHSHAPFSILHPPKPRSARNSDFSGSSLKRPPFAAGSARGLRRKLIYSGPLRSPPDLGLLSDARSLAAERHLPGSSAQLEEASSRHSVLEY